MDKALLRALILLPFWLFLTAMLLGFLGGGVADFDGLRSKTSADATALLFFLTYFPVAIWIYRRKGSDSK